MGALLPRGLCATVFLFASATSLFAQQDPGIRGGFNNTAGMLQYRGIKIPAPPVISPHPVTGATLTSNALASFNESNMSAGQLEASCNECAMITEGTPV